LRFNISNLKPQDEKKGEGNFPLRVARRKEKLIGSMKVGYFQDIDTDAIYACVGPWGINGMFRLRNPQAKDKQWEFLVPNSPNWNWVHQRIYRNPRVEEATPDAFPVPLPPLPETPPGPFPERKDYFLPEQPIQASAYPLVTRFLTTQKENTAAVFVVLSEDRYETLLGDGEFHHFKHVFLTQEEAQRFMDQNRSEGESFHLRAMTIKLDYEVLAFPDFEQKLFDEHKVEEVVKALESLLRT
jgi:hypothetical protein